MSAWKKRLVFCNWQARTCYATQGRNAGKRKTHLEEVQPPRNLALVVGLSRQDNDETNQARNGHRHRRENARETPCLAHGD